MAGAAPLFLLQPFQDRISSLESIIALQGERIAALEATASHQEENLLIQLQLIKQLRESGRKPSIGTKTIARIAKIDEILKSRGPTTLKELERTLGIDRATMTRLLESWICGGMTCTPGPAMRGRRSSG